MHNLSNIDLYTTEKCLCWNDCWTVHLVHSGQIALRRCSKLLTLLWLHEHVLGTQSGNQTSTLSSTLVCIVYGTDPTDPRIWALSTINLIDQAIGGFSFIHGKMAETRYSGGICVGPHAAMPDPLPLPAFVLCL